MDTQTQVGTPHLGCSFVDVDMGDGYVIRRNNWTGWIGKTTWSVLRHGEVIKGGRFGHAWHGEHGPWTTPHLGCVFDEDALPRGSAFKQAHRWLARHRFVADLRGES